MAVLADIALEMWRPLPPLPLHCVGYRGRAQQLPMSALLTSRSTRALNQSVECGQVATCDTFPFFCPLQAGMFNDRSTHSERQQVLQKLMQKGTADLGEGVPSDAELNSLLARSKAELVSFAQVLHLSPDMHADIVLDRLLGPHRKSQMLYASAQA